eukprot:SAG22_NODE_2735_length_2266_cov_1.352100_2_plen_199_part_00
MSIFSAEKAKNRAAAEAIDTQQRQLETDTAVTSEHLAVWSAAIAEETPGKPPRPQAAASTPSGDESAVGAGVAAAAAAAAATGGALGGDKENARPEAAAAQCSSPFVASLLKKLQSPLRYSLGGGGPAVATPRGKARGTPQPFKASSGTPLQPLGSSSSSPAGGLGPLEMGAGMGAGMGAVEMADYMASPAGSGHEFG